MEGPPPASGLSAPPPPPSPPPQAIPPKIPDIPSRRALGPRPDELGTMERASERL